MVSAAVPLPPAGRRAQTPQTSDVWGGLLPRQAHWLAPRGHQVRGSAGSARRPDPRRRLHRCAGGGATSPVVLLGGGQVAGGVGACCWGRMDVDACPGDGDQTGGVAGVGSNRHPTRLLHGPTLPTPAIQRLLPVAKAETVIPLVCCAGPKSGASCRGRPSKVGPGEAARHPLQRRGAQEGRPQEGGGVWWTEEPWLRSQPQQSACPIVYQAQRNPGPVESWNTPHSSATLKAA